MCSRAATRLHMNLYMRSSCHICYDFEFLNLPLSAIVVGAIFHIVVVNVEVESNLSWKHSKRTEVCSHTAMG